MNCATSRHMEIFSALKACACVKAGRPEERLAAVQQNLLNKLFKIIKERGVHAVDWKRIIRTGWGKSQLLREINPSDCRRLECKWNCLWTFFSFQMEIEEIEFAENLKVWLLLVCIHWIAGQLPFITKFFVRTSKLLFFEISLGFV